MIRSLAVSIAGLVLLAVSATAQNLATNADFDDDVSTWVLRDGSSLIWYPVDPGGCSGSGSAAAASVEIPMGPGQSADVVGVIQCFDAPVSGKLFYTLLRTSAVSTSLFLSFHQSAACGDESPTVVNVDLDPTAGWEAGGLLDVEVPPGTQSVRFGVEALSLNLSFEVWLDRVYVGTDEPIFLDGFDGDLLDETSPCRWSSTAP